MIFPWTSRRKIESLLERMDGELSSIRKKISKKKRKIRRMEKELYWGGVSFRQMKNERKALAKLNKRGRKIKRKLERIEEKLSGRNAERSGE